MREFIENLRKQVAFGSTEETYESTNLCLTKEQFCSKMLVEKDGQALLDLLEMGEWRVAEHLGLIKGYHKENQTCFDVPRWNNLVQHLRIVNSV